MAFPVTLNGRTYTLADFSGTAYVDGFPDALEDFVTHAGNTYLTTSTTSTTLGTGSKTFTVADSGKPYASGTPLRISSSADETDFMDGLVTSYSGTTLTVNVVGFSGSGTLASWNINIGGGPITVSGTLPINQGGTGATTASAAASALGVGTEDSPTFTGLTVTGTANFSDIDLSNVGDIALDSISSDSGGAIQVTLGTDAGDDFKVNNGSDVLLVEGDTSAVTIAGELTVKDIVMSDADTPKITMTDTTNTLTTFIQSGNSSSIIGTSTSHPLRLQTNSTDAIYVDTSQNVGIGTSSPSSFFSDANQLVVGSGSGSQGITISSGTSENAQIFFADGTSGDAAYRGIVRYLHSSDAMAFYTSGANERMRIDSSGKVAMGTTSADADASVLTIKGTDPAQIYDGQIIIHGSATSGAADTGAGIGFKGHHGTGNRNLGAIQSLKENATSGNADAYMRFITRSNSGGLAEAMRIDSSGNVAIGTTSAGHPLRVSGGGFGTIAKFSSDDGSNNPRLLIYGSSSGMHIQRTSGSGASNLIFNIGGSEGGGTERLRITGTGDITTTGSSTFSRANAGFTARAGDSVAITRNAGTVLEINRSNDGTLVDLRSATVAEGNISVSGTTVSYNGGHLSRWSQLTDSTKDTSIVKGTVMTNLDQMAVWSHDAVAATYYTDDDELPEGVSVGDEKTPAVDAFTEDNEQLNCMAVSSVEGDTNVAGVFVNWDYDDDQFNDMNVAMTGDMVIRIASGTTVARGDLLMSAGDGTAKPQADDIVRSKTIAKVTSTHVSHTYDDNSYLVPVVLMAC